MEGSRVNLRGMIKLDQVEDLLSGLMEKMNSQEVTIKRMQQQLDLTLNLHSAQESFASLHRQLKAAQHRIEVLENDSKVDIGASSSSASPPTSIVQVVPVKSLTRENHERIKELHKYVIELAKKNDVDERFQDLSKMFSEEIKDVRDKYATKELALQLQDGEQMISNRLVGMESLLSCKIDRSELAHLDALAVRLKSFSEFKDNTLLSLIDLVLLLFYFLSLR